ncbi:MAG TPA: hypothetical protein VFO25_13955 [Candidatus Eremiobacteraceae bacterium]|nr:hypothetical protein [Candidatus Eremiobacteraceae bacterium]
MGKHLRALIATCAALTICAIVTVTIPPARAAIEGAMSCALSTPCLEWDNTGSGDAIKGVSMKGNALHGQTKFKSAGKTAGKAGVLGEDLSTSGNLDSGVLGTSTFGAGVTGTSASYNAVQGLSALSTGVYGQTAGAGAFGVAGRDIATTHDNNGAGVLADGGPADDGLHAFGNGTSANGIYAFSQSASSIVTNQGPNDSASSLVVQHTSGPTNLLIEGVGPSGDVFQVSSTGAGLLSGNLIVGKISDQGTLSALGSIEGGNGLRIDSGTVTFSAAPGASQVLDIFSGTSNTGTGVLNLENSSGTADFNVTDGGDIFIDGLIHTHGSCNSGCIIGGKRVHDVDEYAPMETEPTIEDNGEATLIDGVANVALDPKFVNVIDPASEYLVAVTPEGDCEGLFVATRGPNGFIVRELRHGHHSLSFEYRIVAKRTGVDAPRLPMTNVTRMAPPERMHPHTSRPGAI